jgi:hypothetical protein
VRAGCEIRMGFTFCRGAEGGKIEERAVATSNGKLQGCSHGRSSWREPEGYQEKTCSLASWHPMRLLQESAANCFLIRNVPRCSKLEDSTQDALLEQEDISGQLTNRSGLIKLTSQNNLFFHLYCAALPPMSFDMQFVFTKSNQRSQAF